MFPSLTPEVECMFVNVVSEVKSPHIRTSWSADAMLKAVALADGSRMMIPSLASSSIPENKQQEISRMELSNVRREYERSCARRKRRPLSEVVQLLECAYEMQQQNSTLPDSISFHGFNIGTCFYTAIEVTPSN